MAVFPIFHDLSGKKCVVIGGGTVAARKIATLVDFDAEVVVVSPALSQPLQDMLRRGRITYIPEKYAETDLAGAFLVVAATDNRMVNEKIYHDAVKNGIWVNVADNPRQCNFIFPSVIKKGDLVIGISTSGKYPALSKRIRKEIDNLLTQRMKADILEVLEKFRQKVFFEIENEAERSKILARILDEVAFRDVTNDNQPIDTKIASILGEFQNEKDH